MKKLLSVLILLSYSCSSALAFSELYYFKGVNVSEIMPKVKNAYETKSFTLLKENPYYGKSNKTPEDYAVVILQQSGQNMFYYYQSNNNKAVNKYILKQVKSSGIELEQSEDSRIIGIYDKLAGEVINPAQKTVYNFEEEDTSTQDFNTKKTDNGTLRGYVAQIQKGTKFSTYLQNAINTSTASVGDEVIAILSDNWTYNGSIIAPQGSVVYGSLTLAHPARYGSRNGRVVIDFNKIVTPDGKILNISTEKIDFSVENDGKIASTAKNVATGAIVGALGGLLVAALSGGDNIGRAVAIGTAVGAGGSLAGSTIEKGVDAEIPSYTELEIELSKTLRITLSE